MTERKPKSKYMNIKVEIYNNMGQKIRSLVNQKLNFGDHLITWNGRNDKGVNVPSGLYYCKISAGNRNKSIKMLLLK